MTDVLYMLSTGPKYGDFEEDPTPTLGRNTFKSSLVIIILYHASWTYFMQHRVKNNRKLGFVTCLKLGSLNK